MVHGACCIMVRGAWCVVRGAWCVVRGAWCMLTASSCTPTLILSIIDLNFSKLNDTPCGARYKSVMPSAWITINLGNTFGSQSTDLHYYESSELRTSADKYAFQGRCNTWIQPNNDPPTLQRTILLPRRRKQWLGTLKTNAQNESSLKPSLNAKVLLQTLWKRSPKPGKRLWRHFIRLEHASA